MKKVISLLLLLIITANLIALPGAEAVVVKTKPVDTDKISLNIDIKLQDFNGFKFNYKSKMPLSLFNYSNSLFTKKTSNRFFDKAALAPRFQNINIDYNKILLNNNQIKVNMDSDK